MSTNNYCIYNNEPVIVHSISTLSLIYPFMFYVMLGYSCYKLASLHYKTLKTLETLKPLVKCINDDDSTIKHTYTVYSGTVLKSITLEHDDTYKNNLFKNLLSLHSLDRCYILYFIFKKKGYFISSFISGEKKKYNSYDLFNRIRDYYNLESREFTLDDTTIPDIIITINEENHYLSKSQLLFIQWIYYTGLYEYLTTTIHLKYKILNEMNEEGLFISNVFLRYHMFLYVYEDIIETNKSNAKNDNEEMYNLSDSEELDFSSYVYETDNTYDDAINESNEPEELSSDETNSDET